jgi:predicted DNA-binding ribbon-helix-helix protein|tara:strand:+ start:1262 stop:1477 length:216 start_codon:yes stop_codon:yes gene_type:complete
MDALGLPVDVEFQIHAASLAIQGMDRDELEEAFIEILHQKALDRQMFLGILKDHGIDADITFNLSTLGQLS